MNERATTRDYLQDIIILVVFGGAIIYNIDRILFHLWGMLMMLLGF